MRVINNVINVPVVLIDNKVHNLTADQQEIYWDAYDNNFPDFPKKSKFNLMKKQFQDKHGTKDVVFLPNAIDAEHPMLTTMRIAYGLYQA